jgi:hypothetical protein
MLTPKNALPTKYLPLIRRRRRANLHSATDSPIAGAGWTRYAVLVRGPLSAGNSRMHAPGGDRARHTIPVDSRRTDPSAVLGVDCYFVV